MPSLEDLTCASKSVGELCQKLRKHGVARVPGFCSPFQVAALLTEARTATSNFANYRNPYGPSARFSLDQRPAAIARSRDLIDGDYLKKLPSQFAESRRLLEGAYFRGAVDEFFHGASGFMEVVAFTRDHVPDTKAVYGYLHFDRRHQLKFVLYLNDVDATNGAFGCIPDSHLVGRDLFYRAWRRVLGLDGVDANHVDAAAQAVAEDSAEYRQVPCILAGRRAIGPFAVDRDEMAISGAAGTLVVFDSHILHFGGFVSHAAKERWTLKGHTFAAQGGVFSE